MNKRVLFIYPSCSNRASIPAALPILMGIADAHGWEMRYFDTCSYTKGSDSIEAKEQSGCFIPSPKEIHKPLNPYNQIKTDLQKEIDLFEPSLIAITAMTDNYEFLMKFWNRISTHGAIRLIGGFHATTCPIDVMATGLFDLLCWGQGEETFSVILELMNHNAKPFRIDGTLWWEDGEINTGHSRKLVDSKCLYSIEPDYSLFGKEYYQYPFDGKSVRMVQIEAGRGCPYDCSYCGNSILKDHYKGLGQYLVVRPLDSLFKLLKYFVEEKNIGMFSFTDECFLSKPHDWIEKFCKRYSKEIQKPFLIQTRPETIRKETLDLLNITSALFIQIGMGVESGTPRILRDLCNRTVRIEETIRAYDLMRTYPQIRSNAYFMIGFPTETREEIFNTIKLCKRLNSKVNSVAIYQPFPGQKLKKFCEDKGFITGQESMGSFVGPSILKQPQISGEEIQGLWRTFMLYAKLPEELKSAIERCEKDPTCERYEALVKLRWDIEEYGMLGQNEKGLNMFAEAALLCDYKNELVKPCS